MIDPGVGSARRGLAVDTGDYRFVAPDNGVLTAVFQEVPPKRVVELTERRYARPTISRAFEGRVYLSRRILRLRHDGLETCNRLVEHLFVLMLEDTEVPHCALPI